MFFKKKQPEPMTRDEVCEESQRMWKEQAVYSRCRLNPELDLELCLPEDCQLDDIEEIEKDILR